MGPVLSRCAGMDWLWAGLGAALAAGILRLLFSRRKAGDAAAGAEAGVLPRVLRIPGGVLLLLLAARAAVAGAGAFPETAGNLLAAGLLLALSLWAAQGGAEAAERCAGILLRLVLALFLTVAVFSLPQLRVSWLRPAFRPGDALICAGLLLVPGAACFLRRGPGRTDGRALWLMIPAAAGAAAVTGGVLSPALAAGEDSFLTLARSVSVLGVMRRFEALVSGAVLPAWFCLCTLLLCAARDAFGVPEGPSAPVVRIARAALCFALLPAAKRLNPVSVAVISSISCGLIPLILLSVEREKNSQKIQKKC